MIHQILKSLGLTTKESKVYLALLEIGEQPVSVLAKKAELNRTTCYDILNALIEKGLVSSFIKRNTKFFSASDPKSILVYLEKLESDIRMKKSILSKNLHLLSQITARSQVVPKVRFFEGFEGIMNVYNDSLNSDIIYSFIDSVDYPKELDDFVYKDYIPRRIKKKISVHEIAPNTEANKIPAKNKINELRTTRYLPVDLAINIEINVYNNKVAFMSFKNGKYVGIIIENEEIYKAMLSIHKTCWMFAESLDL